MKEKENRCNRKKWIWDLNEIIDPMLSERDIKKAINKKLAYIIVELEHNPVSYIKIKKNTGEML